MQSSVIIKLTNYPRNCSRYEAKLYKHLEEIGQLPKHRENCADFTSCPAQTYRRY